MRILIIGGTNFIGPYVVRALHQLGTEITVYHRGVHEPSLPAEVRHIRNARATLPFLHFPSELTDPSPDVVVHMFPVGGDDARAAVARFTGAAGRIVAISSGDVYRAYGRLTGHEPGPPEPVPLGESAPLRENFFPHRDSAAGPSDWIYHYEKILAERAVLASMALPGTVLRLPVVYGPGDPYRRFRSFVKRMDDRRPAILLEQAQAGWRWSHGYVENVAQAIALAVVDKRAARGTYNIGEPVVPTVDERVRQLADVAGWNGKIVSLSAERLPPHLRPPYQPAQDLVMDTNRFRSDLGFMEPVSREEALRRTIDWERTHPPETGDPGALEYAAEDTALGDGVTRTM